MHNNKIDEKASTMVKIKRIMLLPAKWRWLMSTKAGKRFIGKFEQEFIEAISFAGIPNIPQDPFLSYNLDIGCGDIAVEIHRHTDSPLAPRHIKKVMNCINAGKSMLYVWINPTKNILLPECYENVVSIIQQFRSNPPVRSKYWVIRGTGKLYATGSFD